MSEQWRTVVERESDSGDAQAELMNRQLAACLIAMARHLVEAHRTRGDSAENDVLLSPDSDGGEQTD